jgi:sugar transferase EpsL
MKQQGWRLTVKRASDVTAALFSLAVLSPVLIIVGLWLRLTLGRPVLFRQGRPGQHARPFRVVKFRTMLDTRDGTGQLLPDAERLTTVGRFLRATSLDELPQLWNVLRGELSLVGPRPLLMQYLERYTPTQARRHEVLPGITGWAQINGRNALSWDQKFALDVWYVEHWSLLLDARIIARTLWKTLRGEGIDQPGQRNPQEFMGSSKQQELEGS